jgi:hypothetical protein
LNTINLSPPKNLSSLVSNQVSYLDDVGWYLHEVYFYALQVVVSEFLKFLICKGRENNFNIDSYNMKSYDTISQLAEGIMADL